MLPLVLIIATERRARDPAAARGVCIRLLRPRAMPTSSKGDAGVATPLAVLTTAGFPPWKGRRKAWAVCAAASRVVAPARRRNLFFLVEVVVVMVDDMEAHCCCLLRCRPMQVVLIVVVTVRVCGRGRGGGLCECEATGG